MLFRQGVQYRQGKKESGVDHSTPLFLCRVLWSTLQGTQPHITFSNAPFLTYDPRRTRTCNQGIKSPLLYHLS